METVNTTTKVPTKRITLAILLLLIIGFIGWYFWQHAQKPSPEALNTVVSQIEEKKSEAPVFLPSRLIIPELSIDTKIVEVGQTAAGNMDVPQNLVDVGWYKYGVKPGEKGNAVVAGHVNGRGNKKAVFWYLKTLEVGDDVYVVDNSGQKLHFRVVDSQVYPADNSPLEYIFGATEKTRLNLITCSFNDEAGRNSDRRVVFTERVFDEPAS